MRINFTFRQRRRNNDAYIQFEICEDKLADKTDYEKAFAVAAEYCAELCKTYGLSVDKVVGHGEAYRLGYGSNHSDPEHWMKKFGERMDDFRKRVSEILKSNNGKTETKQETDSENKIVEEKQGSGATKWGKLKTGAGWILLDYVKKL